jgi:uncharacterized membrane protein YeaQ/YmgE (transglycosylase-associated protein family)
MPLNWYLALVLVSGCIALGDQLVHLRWSRGGFLLALVLALAGTALGWALCRGMDLPELVPMKVEGKDFPLLWALIGGAVFVGTFEQFASRRRRHRA